MDSIAIERTLELYPTPFYLFDEGEVHAQIEHLRSLLPARAQLCYAMKANSFILRQAARDADRIEACSPGELRTCLALGVPEGKIVISGVHKNEALMRELVDEHPDIARYTAESTAQFDLLERCARAVGRRIPLLLRLTSGNQFGMDADAIKGLAQRCIDNPAIDFCGIQYFSGTQKTSPKRIDRELKQLDALIAELEHDCNIPVAELEYGAGLPVLYFDSEQDAAARQDELATTVGALLDGMAFAGELSIELGRSIAASCGTYATRVVDAKRNAGDNYAIVDGGRHHIAYYGNALAMKQPPCRVIPERTGETREAWNICGSLCTVNDILAKQLDLCDLRIGDVLVFERAGAYCMTEGISLFLSRDLPRVILRDIDGHFELARERFETYPLNTPAPSR